MSKTTTLLVQHLKDKPESQARDSIIETAISGYYGDFTSPIAFPKTALNNDLIDAGYDDLAKNTRNGLYD